jgi:ATP-dependent DNA helicase RecG
LEQSPGETGIDSLRSVLELECRKGYDDRAVIGGLDKFLRRQAGRILQDIPDRELLASFNNLGFTKSDYRSWDKKRRREWITATLNWLARAEEARERKRTTAAAGSPAAAARTPGLRKTSPALDLPVTGIRGIAAGTAGRFARLGVKTVYDLLYFFPRRYIDYSRRKLIAELEQGKEQTIIATVWQSRIVTLGRKRGTELIVADDTGNIRVVWFNQPYLAKNFRINATVAISGIVSSFKGQRVFVSPEWELVQTRELIHTARLVPVYPLTSGLYPRQVRKWTREAVDGWAWQLTDFLPPEIKRRCRLPDLPQAIAQAHYPDSAEKAEEARKRLAFDELFLLQLGLLLRKQNWQQSQPGNAFTINQERLKTFLSYLPFALTSAQERVLKEVTGDLKQPRAMSRLLQGEVGSGKTIIATLALLIAGANGYQGALMAPTEVLAEQHFNTISSYLSRAGGQPEPPGQGNLRRYRGIFPRPLTIALLTGSITGSEKEDLHSKIRQGEVDIVIGTHAIIQEEVEFHKLGLAVIDEQHRFGVLQRSALRQKGFNPHILAMTATPIPRTMALTLYGDLDLSIIDELPPGRKLAPAKWLDPRGRGKAYSFIHRQVDKGKQAFIIYPLIEESEVIEAKAATTEYERLSKDVFPDLKLGLMHGRMSPADKEQVMRRFRSGEFDILVSTSVVEVGIDVPNANVILVEGADRFGLSQLHQFRGRVGRDKEQGYCLLISDRLSREGGAETGKSDDEWKHRLKLLEEIQDGFKLAEEDLKLRGPGEFFGTQQSGLPELKIASITNLELLETARREATAFFQNSPAATKDKTSPLGKKLARMWQGHIEWS